MEAERHVKGTISRSLEENNHHFNEVREWPEKWAEDMVLAEEKELKDTKQQIGSRAWLLRWKNSMNCKRIYRNWKRKNGVNANRSLTSKMNSLKNGMI
jgi:hypothetical protein